MAADPNIGFNYMPEWTMSGILHDSEDGLPHFSSRIHETDTTVLTRGMGCPITICSSSNGLVAWHNPKSNIYYIWNPEHLDSYIALPQPPRQHYVLPTHVVLAVNFSVVHSYHLICAIHVDERPIRYTFDTYTSSAGEWVSYEAIDVGGLIHPDTGVSCGVFAYWLTEEPWSVIRFDVYNPHVRWQRFLISGDNAILQLGRVSNKLGLVCVDNSSNPRITLSLLQEEGSPVPWKQYTYALPILNPNMLPLRPIRFESFKFEVFLSAANGKLMLCETSIVEPHRHRVRLLNISKSSRSAVDGFPLISSRLLPAFFPASAVS